MSALHDLQARFRDAVFGRDDARVADAIAAGAPGPAARLAVYRRNAFGNLAGALEAIYPVVYKLVGGDFFRYAAGEFIAHAPSHSGDLNDYGLGFADFLAGFAPAAELVYLPDTARLEWLVHETYFAADRAPLDPRRFAVVPPAHFAALHLRLHPAVRRFQSPFPVHRIWQVNQDGYGGDTTVDLRTGGVRLLIRRDDGVIEFDLLDAGTWQLLEAIAAGATLGDAVAAALAVAPETDVAALLHRLVTTGAVVDFPVS
jgi:hypothetical protein